MSNISEDLETMRNNPAMFCRAMLGVEPTPQQEKLLDAVHENKEGIQSMVVRNNWDRFRAASQVAAVALICEPEVKVVVAGDIERVMQGMYDIFKEAPKWLRRTLEWSQNLVKTSIRRNSYCCFLNSDYGGEDIAGMFSKRVLFIQVGDTAGPLLKDISRITPGSGILEILEDKE